MRICHTTEAIKQIMEISNNVPKVELILASGSPRRKEMLQNLGVNFSVYVTDTDESRKEGELAEDFVARLARDKARAAQQKIGRSDPIAILAADTIVVQNGRVYGKPTDFEHAKRIWQSLSGNKHQVMTAISLLHGSTMSVKVSVTEVEFARITETQMQRYWQTDEPKDKAGAYAIQGLACAWVKSIKGSYSNVVGLPLREVNLLLSEIELNWL